MDLSFAFDTVIVCKYCGSQKFCNNTVSYINMFDAHACPECGNTVIGPATQFFQTYTGLIHRALFHIHKIKDLRLLELTFRPVFDVPEELDLNTLYEDYGAPMMKRTATPAGFDIHSLHFECHKCDSELSYDWDYFLDTSEPPKFCQECDSRISKGRRTLVELFNYWAGYGACVRGMDLSGFAVIPIERSNAAFDYRRVNIPEMLPE